MITSLQNPLVKQIRKLHRRKGRREQNLVILEGTHLLETASEGQCSLETVCYTQDWQIRYPQLWEFVSQQAKRLILVSPEVLQSLTTTVNPDGVVATLLRTEAQNQSSISLNLGLILEKLQDPGNLGTIIRTSVATGLQKLYLSQDSVEFDHPKVLRASAGAWFHLPLEMVTDLKPLIQKYKSQGVQTIATLPKAEKTYWEIDFTQPTLILMGNEGAGLSPDLLDLADQWVTIPQQKQVESLNVAIATAVILYEVQRQRLYQ